MLWKRPTGPSVVLDMVSDFRGLKRVQTTQRRKTYRHDDHQICGRMIVRQRRNCAKTENPGKPGFSKDH
jgi:hypothetical protein